MKNRKLLSLALAGLLSLSLTACGGDDQTSTGDKVYKVGISQYVTHPALDDATEGFIAAMNDKLGEDGWEYDLQNAAEDPALCSTIAGTFVSDGVDLIMARRRRPPPGTFLFWEPRSLNTAWPLVSRISPAHWAPTSPAPPTWPPWTSRPR